MGLHLTAGELMNCQAEVSTWASVLFEPADIVEVRCLPPKHITESLNRYRFAGYSTSRQNGIYPWIEARDLATLVRPLSQMNSSKGVPSLWEMKAKAPTPDEPARRIIVCPLSVFCSANPRRNPGNSTGKNVLLARSLFADFDRISVEGAAQRLEASKLPQPTMVVSSGHGVHCYWRLTEPMHDLRLWTTYQKRLIRLLGSDASIHDPPRIMRLPGFLNHNAPSAKTFICHTYPNRRYDLAIFDSLLPPHSTAKQGPKVSLPVLDQDDDEDEQLSENTEPGEAIHRAIAYMKAFPPAQVGERNSKLFALCANLVEKFDVKAGALLEIGTAYNARCSEPLDEGEVEEVTRKAFKHIQDKGIPRGIHLRTDHEAEPYQEPTKEIVPLPVWRSQLVKRRIASLQKPGTLHFDRSPAGSGKSTADRTAMKVAGKSITFLPTHQGCRELIAELEREGLAGASYPPINEETCQRTSAPVRPPVTPVSHRKQD